jgi:hypothetical protein
MHVTKILIIKKLVLHTMLLNTYIFFLLSKEIRPIHGTVICKTDVPQADLKCILSLFLTLSLSFFCEWILVKTLLRWTNLFQEERFIYPDGLDRGN